MEKPDINFFQLETDSDRKIVLEYFVSLFDKRPYFGQEPLKFAYERIWQDSENCDLLGIFRSLETIGKIVWEDDLHQGTPYADAIRDLNRIAGEPLQIVEIEDGYAQSEPGADFDVAITTNRGVFRGRLNHGSGLHFGFLRPFFEAFDNAGVMGEFVGVQFDDLESGVAIIFANPEEHARLEAAELFNLYDLDERVISECVRAYWRPYKAPQLVGAVADLKGYAYNGGDSNRAGDAEAAVSPTSASSEGASKADQEPDGAVKPVKSFWQRLLGK